MPYTYKEDTACIIPTFKHELEFVIYEDNKFFDKIHAELKVFAMPEYISAEYDKIDMQNAEWYEIYTGEYQYPQPDNDFGYLHYTFNLRNYCPECGIGKIQNNPFRLKYEPKQKNNQFWGLYWERNAIFVREEAKNILQKENIKGVHFLQPVLHKSNKPIDRFYQLIIDTELDNGLDLCNVQEISCIHCNRIKYYFPKGDTCIYNKKIFYRNVDFYKTSEYFGSGAYAEKINIISKKVYEIVKYNNLK